MKYILITGAFGGMGRQAALLFAKQGYSVFALDIKTEAINDSIIPLQADITNIDDLTAAYKKVSGITPSLCGILHFAGVYMLDSLVEISSQEYKRAFDINFFGACNVNRVFFPLLSHGSRVIITTSELAPLDPLPFTGIYSVTKAALDKYAYSLAMESQLLGVTVSVLRAGAVDTGMLGVSTSALNRFCDTTSLYTCNAGNFKRIVDSVEAKRIPPQLVARKAYKIFSAPHPRFAYSINRNPLLILLNSLPKRLQLYIIRRILK